MAISGLRVALAVLEAPRGEATKPFESTRVPSVAAVAAAVAVETDKGGASGADEMPGSGAMFSGTNDEERIFLAERWFSSSGGVAVSWWTPELLAVEDC